MSVFVFLLILVWVVFNELNVVGRFMVFGYCFVI